MPQSKDMTDSIYAQNYKLSLVVNLVVKKELM